MGVSIPLAGELYSISGPHCVTAGTGTLVLKYGKGHAYIMV